MPGTQASVRALCVAGLMAVAGAQQQQGTRVGAVVPPLLIKNGPPPVTALPPKPGQPAPAPQPQLADPGYGTTRDVAGQAVNPNTPAIDAARPNIPIASQAAAGSVSVTTTTATVVLARNVTVTTTLTTPVLVPVVPVTSIPSSIASSVVAPLRTAQPNPVSTTAPTTSSSSVTPASTTPAVAPRPSVSSAPVPVASAPAQPSPSTVTPTPSSAQPPASPSIWRPASSSSAAAPAVASSAPAHTPVASVPVSTQAPGAVLGVKSQAPAAVVPTPSVATSPSSIVKPIAPVPSTSASHVETSTAHSTPTQAPSSAQAKPVASQSPAAAQTPVQPAHADNKPAVTSVNQVHAVAPHPTGATAANTTRPANSTQPAVAIMSQTPMHTGPLASGGVRPMPATPPKDTSKDVKPVPSGTATAIKQIGEEGTSTGLEGWQIAVISAVACLLLLTIVLAVLLVRRYKKTHPAKVVMYSDKKALVHDDQEPISDVLMTPMPRAAPVGAPAAVADKIDVTFALHCNHVSSSEYIILTGADPALGNWQVSAAPCMKFMGGSRYMYTAALPTDQVVEYKYAKMRPDGTTVYMDGPSFGVITGRKSHTLEATPWLKSSF